MGHRLSNIYYFLDERGNSPVKEFITSLPVKERAKVFAYFHELMRQGYNLRRPMADYLGYGIYELRPKNNRIFYFFFLKDVAVFLHAIKKKTYKIPESDLNICIKRKLQVEKNKRIKRVESQGD
ncbi:MAG: type II toxin-antitoxin system RelE/ParE family toxin [Candidatus Gorgyraea atricola]|nr:type II toxin-antitoxin system RelE/ParE family toxin [Candidatus Gorgyraea atricola]